MEAVHKQARPLPRFQQEGEHEAGVHPARDQEVNRALKIFAAAGFAGAVSRSATAPVDRLKMLLMVEETPQAKGLRWGFHRMAAEGSLKSFFRGNGTNVVKIVPETAIKLTGSDVLKPYIVQNLDDIQPQERFVCGAMAGAAAQFSIYPMELIRTRLAVCENGAYRGMFHAAGETIKREGWRAFYRGLTPAMIGILPYAGVDIASFEIMMEDLNIRYEGNVPGPLVLATGMCSSTCAQLVSFPLALVRTRLQAQGIGGKPLKYKSMSDVIQQTVRKEGFRGLYKGLVPNLIKVAPAAGISWFVFDKTKRLLGLNGQY